MFPTNCPLPWMVVVVNGKRLLRAAKLTSAMPNVRLQMIQEAADIFWEYLDWSYKFGSIDAYQPCYTACQDMHGCMAEALKGGDGVAAWIDAALSILDRVERHVETHGFSGKVNYFS